MAGFMVPCPHPELCGAISHLYGSVDSIECMMKTHANLGNPEYRSLLIESDLTSIEYNGPLPAFEGLLQNPPPGLMGHMTVVSDILRAEADHARLLNLQSGFLNANYPQVKIWTHSMSSIASRMEIPRACWSGSHPAKLSRLHPTPRGATSQRVARFQSISLMTLPTHLPRRSENSGYEPSR